MTSVSAASVHMALVYSTFSGNSFKLQGRCVVFSLSGPVVRLSLHTFDTRK